MAKDIVQVSPEKFPWLDLNRYSFSMGCMKGDFLVIAGQTASCFYPEEGHIRCKGDVVEQTKLAWEKIGTVLDAAGMTYDNIVKTVDYIDPTALPKYKGTAEVRRQYLGDSPVAATGIISHDILRPDALIEINAVAVKGKKEIVFPKGPDFEHYKGVTYTPGVKVGNKIWLAGTIGSERDVTGKRVHPAETAEQLKLSYREMDQVLKAAGAEPSDVLYAVDYVSAHAGLHYSEVDKARQSYFKGTYPATADVIVNRLLSSNAHVETEMTAVTGVQREEFRIKSWDKSYDQITSSQALKMGNIIYFSVQASIDHTTGESLSFNYDVVEQGRQAYRNLAKLCAEGGITMDDILYTVEFLPPNALDAYKGIGKVRKEFFGDRFPAATGMVMHGLRRPEQLIEVLAVAAV
jgi:enamine deaminase RidA (YjgF/YER057c/UK114 family)